jgi:fructokinase
MKIISIGEILWDVYEKRTESAEAPEHLGGAPFNFAANAARLGHNVIFLSAVGDDDRGRRALGEAARLGIPAAPIQTTGRWPTGIVSVDLDERENPRYRIHRPAAYDALALDDAAVDSLAAGNPDWIYFGTLYQAHSSARRQTGRIIAAAPSARCFYDVNLRPNSYTPALVRDLLKLADVVKLNEDECGVVGRMLDRPHESIEEFCRYWAAQCEWESVSVTRGARGCAIFLKGSYVEVPGYKVEVKDAVGAGDAFAAAFLHGLGAGWPAERIGDFANRAGAFVAGRPGALPPWTAADLEALQH